MKDITIIAVGNIKESYYKEAIEEYCKRISAYARITVKELKEEKLPDDETSEGEIKKALDREGEAILASLPKNAYIAPLCVEGKKYTSEGFAAFMEKASSEKPIVFIIGSSHGLSETIKAKADGKISFSDMTFPHRLMRVILCEQIYRGLSILNNGKYHK